MEKAFRNSITRQLPHLPMLASQVYSCRNLTGCRGQNEVCKWRCFLKHGVSCLELTIVCLKKFSLGKIFMLMRSSQNMLCAILFTLSFALVPAIGDQIQAPILLEKSDYTESWDQQFLFENNTVISSQFLIVNLPFSKFHGMMVATLKEPQKAVVVIKNGRRRSGWNFSAEERKLTIFQHQLSGASPGYLMRLHNTTAEVDLLFTTPAQAISLVEGGGKLGLPKITLYAPPARAFARWRPGPEIDGPGEDGEWNQIGDGFGYGLHIVQTKPMNATIKRWRRFTGDRAENGYRPVLHVIDTPKGKREMVMLLFPPFGKPARFNVTEFAVAADEKSWHFEAHNGDNTLSGTIALTAFLENFTLKDQLNGIEKLAAGSLADVSHDHHAATYKLSLNEQGITTILEGRAMAEDVRMGKAKPKRRRTRR
jgi:hypothetical protein